MQNRYAGDVGDFGKLGMLRYLASAKLKVGVNWYLTADETHNEDGKYIGYLHDPKFIGCDDALLDKLRELVSSGQRSVQAIQNSMIVPHGVYYDKQLVEPGGSFDRTDWHKQAVEALQPADIIFLDPDNGILPKSVSETGNKSVKYIFQKELSDYYQSGHSIVFYNHRRRMREDAYLSLFSPLFDSYRMQGAQIMGVKYMRGTLRDYFFVLRPEHYEQVKRALSLMLGSRWNQHFKLLTIPANM